MQRLAALQRPGCGFAAAGGFAAAEAAALQQLAALQRQRLQLAASQRLEERKRSALPERVPLRQRKVVVAGETAPLGAGQRMLHRTNEEHCKRAEALKRFCS